VKLRYQPIVGLSQMYRGGLLDTLGNAHSHQANGFTDFPSIPASATCYNNAGGTTSSSTYPRPPPTQRTQPPASGNPNPYVPPISNTAQEIQNNPSDFQNTHHHYNHQQYHNYYPPGIVARAPPFHGTNGAVSTTNTVKLHNEVTFRNDGAGTFTPEVSADVVSEQAVQHPVLRPDAHGRISEQSRVRADMAGMKHQRTASLDAGTEYSPVQVKRNRTGEQSGETEGEDDGASPIAE
jgi:hypothetical protein